MRYKITEECPIIDRSGEYVSSHLVFRRIDNGRLNAYCNKCEDCGCMLEATAEQVEGANLQHTTGQVTPLPFDKCMVEGCNNEAVVCGGRGRFCLYHG